MLGSSVTEFEIGPNYYTARDLAPWEARLAEHTETREEGDEKETHNCHSAVPSLFLWSCQTGKERGPRLVRGKAAKPEVLVFRLFPAPQNEAHKCFPPT